MMDIVYYYWNPDKIPQKSREDDRGGFAFPFRLVMLGWQEWKQTGRYPNPTELARRIVPSFIADIQYMNELIERGKPKDKDVQREGR